VRLHPDDPDLGWALVGALHRADRTDEAVAWLGSISERWPGRRSEWALDLGALLYAEADHAHALEVLEAASERDPAHASLRLYRALVLQALGRNTDAEHELALLAQLDPDLAAESLLLRAIGRLTVGDQAGGKQFLQEVLSLEPEGESASRARELLAELEDLRAPSRPRGSIWARFAGEVDSNVTLDSGTALEGISTDQSDSRLGWGGGVAFEAVRGSWGALALGYNYSESAHEDLKRFDLRTHTVFGSLRLRAPGRLRFRLDALGSDVHLDDDRYLRTWTLRPNVFVALSEALGISRLYLQVERRAYHEKPILSSLDRDGATYTAGLEHHARIPWREGATGSLGVELARTNTEASTDLLGFEGDYDNRMARVTGQAQIPVYGPFYARLGGRLAWYRYVNRNVVDALTDEGVGTPNPSRRSDSMGEATAALGWDVTPEVSVELRWRGTRNRSNVDLYDYERHVVGVYFTARRALP
jgi:tetratricopeptide (TPR) repeat protein